jgi:hypothetical protein
MSRLLLSTTYALQTAFYIPLTYCYQHMNFPITLQNKKTQLIINTSTEIISDLVLFNYFLTPQQISIASVILLLLQQTHPISCLIFSLKRDRSNLLAHSFVNLFSVGSFFSFLVIINPITYLLASLILSRFDCLIPTKWLEGSKLQTSKLSSLWQLNLFLI